MPPFDPAPRRSPSARAEKLQKKRCVLVASTVYSAAALIAAVCMLLLPVETRGRQMDAEGYEGLNTSPSPEQAGAQAPADAVYCRSPTSPQSHSDPLAPDNVLVRTPTPRSRARCASPYGGYL